MGEFEASVHRRLEEAWGGVNWGVPGSGLEQWNARCCRVESWNRDCSGGHAGTNRAAAPWVAADKGRRQGQLSRMCQVLRRGTPGKASADWRKLTCHPNSSRS